jgi:type IX secretion system PorP/SprF family membrane protein
MKAILPVLLLSLSLCAGAQDLAVFNEYFPEHEILNPAFPGIQNCYSAGILDHHQWVGIKDAPNTQIAFASGRFSQPRAINYHGLGLILSRDQNGSYRHLNAALQYAYHVLLAEKSKTHLSLGLAGIVNQDVLDEGDFYNYNNDPVISGSRLSVWNPDLTLGIGIYNERFFGGITAARLLPNISTLSDPVMADRNRRIYLAFAGSRFAIARRDLEIETSVLFLYEESFYARCDLNAKVIFRSRYWLGVSTRKFIDKDFKGTLVLLPAGGITINRLDIAYSYGLDFSSVQRRSYGSHSLMLRWKLCRESRGSLPCPEAYD